MRVRLRHGILWVVSVSALAAPVFALMVRWHNTRAGERQFTEGLSLLDAPIEQTPSLEALDVARAQSLFEAAWRSHADTRQTHRARALWHVAQAYHDLAKGEFSLALQEADTAEGLCPGDPHVALARATVMARKGDTLRAERILATVSTSPTATPSLRARAALLRVDLLLDQGRAHEALSVAETLDREHPRVSAVKNLLGLARAAVGDRSGARTAYMQSSEIDPRNEAPLVNLARLEREEGNLAAARTLLERALTVAPNSAEVWLAYGIVLADGGHISEARVALTRAASLAPDDASPYVVQGNLDLAEGNLSGAVESFRNALTLAPDHPVAWTNLGIALARQGQRSAAIDAFEHATRHAPQQGEAWNGLGALRLAEGDATRAVGCLQQALVLLPGDPNPAINLGRALESLHRWDDAARAYREALRRNPGHPIAQQRLLRLLPRQRTQRQMPRLASR